jgi:hypothetical protein
VDVVNHLQYNEKMDNQNISGHSYDSDCIFWIDTIYYLEYIFN